MGAGKSKRAVLTILLCNLFLSLTVVFFSPMEVVAANAQEFYFPFGNVWWFQLLAAAGAALVLSGVMLVLPGRAGVAAAGLSLALGIAAYVQILALNGDMTSMSDDMTVTPEGVTRNLVIWGVILAAVIAAVIIASVKHRKVTENLMRFAAAALTVMQLAGFLSSVMTTDLSPNKQEMALTTEDEFILGRDENVIIFVLDTADGSYAREMLERYPELYETLSGWTYYPNATSLYSRTYPSLPYMLTGVENHMDRPVNEFLDEAFTTSPFLKGLSGAGADCRVLTWDPSVISMEADAWLGNVVNYRYGSFSSLNLPGLEKNLMTISLYKCLPYRFKDAFLYETADVNAESFSVEEDSFMEYSYNDDDFLYDLEDAVTVSDRYSKSFRLFHLFGTHYPAHWDENLEPLMDESSEDYAAVLRGSFRNVEELIRQMKELGIYEKATIIVTADHGLSGHSEAGEPLVLKAPACVLMMVKTPDSDLSRPLQVSTAPVCHDDLFATAEKGLGAPVTGTGSGRAFAEIGEGESRDRYYEHTMVRRQNNADIALREYLIRGDAEDLANWHMTGRWWDVVYSTNRISSEPFPDPAEEQNPQ